MRRPRWQAIAGPPGGVADFLEKLDSEGRILETSEGTPIVFVSSHGVVIPTPMGNSVETIMTAVVKILASDEELEDLKPRIVP